jgi:hypothetical protein
MLDFNGFGIGSGQDVQELNKALEGAASLGLQAGVSTAGIVTDGTTGGAALRVQSLDSSLKVITFTDKHINFWKDIPKTPAYSTAEEYNQLTSYGMQTGGFVTEGELPYSTTSDYLRKVALVKYVGTTRSVSHPMTLVRTMVPDVIAQENSNGIMWMLRQIENALFWGNDKGRDASEYVEWAGIDQQIGGATGIGTGGGNNYDMRNVNLATTPFTTVVNSLAQTVVDQFGFPTDIYLPYQLLAKINDEFAGTAAQRIVLPSPAGNTQLNINVDSLMTQAGKVNLKPTYFLQRTRTIPTASKLLKSTTMAAAIGKTMTASSGGTPTTGYVPAAGWYKVNYTFENKYGETRGYEGDGGVATVPAGIAGACIQLNGTTQSIRITLGSADTNDADAAEFVNIFLSPMCATQALAQAATVYWVQRIPLGNAVTTVDWDGRRLPNTYTAFIGQNTSDVLTFRQLAPLVKMDLATIAPAYKWMILLYGMPVIFVPQKWTRVINISL